MKRLLCMFAFLPAAAWCQAAGRCHITGFFMGEVRVYLSVYAANIDGEGLVCGEYAAADNVIHRVFLDKSGHPYFGYDLQVTPDPIARTFHIAALRPSGTFTIPHYVKGQPDEQRRVDGAALRSFSNLPAPVTMADGDRIEIPVLENRSTGERIVDSYGIGMRGTGLSIPLRGFEDAKEAPAGTLLHLEQPALSHDGNDWGGEPDLGVSGPVVWIYTRDRGRFLLSATPRPGYRRAGVAHGSNLKFAEGVEQYSLTLHSNAVEQPGIWWIWVKHEADFKPAPGASPIGAER